MKKRVPRSSTGGVDFELYSSNFALPAPRGAGRRGREGRPYNGPKRRVIRHVCFRTLLFELCTSSPAGAGRHAFRRAQGTPAFGRTRQVLRRAQDVPASGRHAAAIGVLGAPRKGWVVVVMERGGRGGRCGWGREASSRAGTDHRKLCSDANLVVSGGVTRA